MRQNQIRMKKEEKMLSFSLSKEPTLTTDKLFKFRFRIDNLLVLNHPSIAAFLARQAEKRRGCPAFENKTEFLPKKEDKK